MFLRSGKNTVVPLPVIVSLPESTPQDLEMQRQKEEKKKATIATRNAANEKRLALKEKKKELALAAKIKADNAEKVLSNLYSSGLETLCYHFGYCSDVIGDSWVEMYDAYGLEGLKEHLRNTSDFYHKGKKCDVCYEEIHHLHD